MARQKWLGALGVLALLAFGPRAAADELGERQFVIVHRSVDEAYQLVAPFLSDRADVRVVRAEQLLEIRDDPAILIEVARELAMFDVARRAVWMSIRIVKGERRDAPAPDPDRSAGIPPDVGRFLDNLYSYESLGQAELTIREGGTRKKRLGRDGAFRVGVKLGEVDVGAKTVELRELSLERKLRGRGDVDVYRPVIQFSEQLANGKTRVLFATPGVGDRRALFLILQVAIEEPS